MPDTPPLSSLLTVTGIGSGSTWGIQSSPYGPNTADHTGVSSSPSSSSSSIISLPRSEASASAVVQGVKALNAAARDFVPGGNVYEK